jgi:membrane-associated phospholipid phosphatase
MGSRSQPDTDETYVKGSRNSTPNLSDKKNEAMTRNTSTVTRLAENLRVGTAKHTRTLVAGTAAAVLLWRRDALAISVLTGAIGNAILSKVLKRIIKERRPDGAPVSDPGMPSSHAMSLFFFASYLSAAAIVWLPDSVSIVARATACMFLGVFAVNSATWRVEAGLHTSAQVLVGSVIGSIDGLLWFMLTQRNWNLIESLDQTLAQSNASAYIIRCEKFVNVLLVGNFRPCLCLQHAS